MTRAYNTATTQQNSGGAVAGVTAGKNFIINGGFDIWQRGTTSTSAAAYGTADRWYQLIESGSGTWAQETTVVPTGSTDSLKFTASATSSIYPIQAIESLNATRLAGQRVTFSGQVAASTSTAMSMVVSHSSSTNVAPAGSWTNLTAVSGGTATPTSTTFVPISGVYDIPSNAKSIRVIIRTTSTIANGVVVYWGNQQLELGSVATPFSRAGGTIQGELSACQRYYFVKVAAGTQPATFGMASYIASNDLRGTFGFPVEMRVTPTLVATSGTNYYKTEMDNDQFNSVTLNWTTKTEAGWYNSGDTASGTKGQASMVGSNNALSSIALSAEL